MKSSNPHSGVYKAETSRTLDLNGGNPACNQGGIAVVQQAFDMTHACDVTRECGETAPCLQARMGTGGDQVPLTYGIGNGQANEAQGMVTERAQTLTTMHDAQAVMYVSPARGALTVRRLTPLECERLQGYPDGWTDIGDYTDSTGKKRKTSDSARYKALGNSIALPFWRWMFGRMAAYLPEDATLGSLFDGIGGFPLCWENVDGDLGKRNRRVSDRRDKKEIRRSDHMTIQEIYRNVEDLLRDDKGGTNFSPAARYAVRMLLDYAERAVTLEASEQDKDARIAEQEKLIADLNQQVSFLRMTLYDAGL